MKTALLSDPAHDRRQFERNARALTESEVGHYKKLGLIFACMCRGTDPDNAPPEMEWRSGYRGTGGKWFNAHFSAAAGTIDQHKPTCPVRVNRRVKTPLPRLSPTVSLARGYPSIGYLNVQTKGHVPYRFDRHHDLSTRYDGLRLTRTVPSVDEKKAEIENRVVPFSLGSMSAFIRWTTKVVAAQGGTLSAALISHGGGTRSLPGSFFMPTDAARRTRMAAEAVRGWQALAHLQAEAVARKNAPTKFALHPVLMQIIPARGQNAVHDIEQVTGKKWRSPGRALLIRGSGGIMTSGILSALTHDIVCPDPSTKNGIEETLAKGDPVYAFVTPVIKKQTDQTLLPQTLNLEMHIMGPEMVHLGALPPQIEYALRQSYQRGDWRRRIGQAERPAQESGAAPHP